MNKSPSLNILRPSPLITLGPPSAINMPYKVGKELLEHNNNWAAPLLQQPKVSYHVHTPKDLNPPQILESNNEYNLSEEDKTTDVHKLDKSTITQFLNRTSLNIETGEVFELRPISTLLKTSKKRLPFLTVPPPLASLWVSYLHIIPPIITVHGSSITLSEYRGCFFMYDQETDLVVSESANFYCTEGKTKFFQTNGPDVYFEIQKSKPTIILVLILMHSNALDIAAFIEEIITSGTPKDNLKLPAVPFAYSYLSPFQNPNNTNPSFNFPWSLYKPSTGFESLKLSPTTEVDIISLIGKAQIQILPFEKLPKVHLTSDSDENVDKPPLLALSIPQRTFFPTSIISFSSITFSFNNPPKGDYAFFRVFLSNTITNPLKPESSPVFLSKTREPISTFYESNAMPMSKKITFPDIVRIKLDKPLERESNVIVHFITVSKNSTSVYKLTAFPLFIDDQIISTTTHTFFTHQSKDLKNEPDYLSRCQKSKKSTFKLCIDIPEVFYPPPQLMELINQQVPYTVQFDQIKQLPPSIILPQLVPIISKLCSLIYVNTVIYMVDVISMFDENETKPLIKSWLYNNFDVDSLKPKFLSLITAFQTMLQSSIENKNNEVLHHFIKSFDFICDILITSYLLKMEDYTIAPLSKLFNWFSYVIVYFIQLDKEDSVIKFNQLFGQFMFIFHSLVDKCIMNVVRQHIKNILDANKPSALFLIWDFLMPFTDTSEFALFLASHFPIKPISRVLFSPFLPVLSIIYNGILVTLESNESNAILLCCTFLSQLCLPLEDKEIDVAMRYRIAYAFYPMFELISDHYSHLDFDQKIELLPAVLFLLGYTPQQLLRYNFISNTTNSKTQYLKFFESVTNVCLEKIEPNGFNEYNGTFAELTKRILQFLNYNVARLGEVVVNVIEVLNKLTNSPYQIPSNYPKLFDNVARFIHYYPSQKSLVMSLLSIITSKQHLVRCFATSLILIFFKSDYDLRKTVVVSSVEVLDSVTNLMLHSPLIDDIKMYKLMLSTVDQMSFDVYKNQDFTQKLNERTTAANNIANVIEKLRASDHSPEDHCNFVMNIADQYKTYPSMRVNWLREIVQINLKYKSLSSAFVAQLHICALIATVIMHENRLESILESNEFKKQFNLLVCQPLTQGKQLVLSPRLFEFFPSVMLETKIDFSSLSEDFQFIASDFTLQYLNEALSEAVDLANKAKLYYSARPLYSLQLRINAELGKYQTMGEICNKTSILFENLKANGTITHTTSLSFFVTNGPVLNKTKDTQTDKKFIYSIDEDSTKQFIGECKKNGFQYSKVSYFEYGFNSLFGRKGVEFENQHCWNTFRKSPTFSELHNSVTDVNKDEVVLIQYKTKVPLPYYIISSEVVEEQTVKISLVNHAKIMAENLNVLANQCSAEFQRFFPSQNMDKLFGSFSIHFENDIERIISVFNNAFSLSFVKVESLENSEASENSEREVNTTNTSSMFDLLRILKSKNGLKEAQQIANILAPTLDKLMAVFKTAVSRSSDQGKYSATMVIAQKKLDVFKTEFNIEEHPQIKAFEGTVDPMIETFDFQ